MKHSVLLDTSFMIRFLNDEDPLHFNAKGYFKYYLDNGVIMKFSTISIAEYCVVGSIEELPFRNLQILPFNVTDAKKAGEFARIIYEQNKLSPLDLKPRAIIPNDAKLFAQADIDNSVTHFVTSDLRSQKTINVLKASTNVRFDFISIDKPHTEIYGIFDF